VQGLSLAQDAEGDERGGGRDPWGGIELTGAPATRTFRQNFKMARPRKPTKILALQGTARPDRHGKPDEWFDLPAGMPKPPEWLKGEAKKRWLFLCSQPAYASILSVVDDAALLHHCLSWDSVAAKYQSGAPILAFDLTALRASLTVLGLSPSDRAKIKLPEKPKASKWAKFQDHNDSRGTAKPS
jgi:hypothetical protein